MNRAQQLNAERKRAENGCAFDLGGLEAVASDSYVHFAQGRLEHKDVPALIAWLRSMVEEVPG